MIFSKPSFITSVLYVVDSIMAAVSALIANVLFGKARCSSSMEGIARLRAALHDRVRAHYELEKNTAWMDSEDEILARLSAFSPEQVKVRSRRH